MDNHFVIDPQPECKDLAGFFTQQFCLPDVEICDETPTDGIVSACDDTWNCNICDGEKVYFNPYVRGDKIQIQTMFLDYYNPDKTDPASGWGTPATSYMAAVIYDNEGNSQSFNLSEFASRTMVAWNGTNSYQIIEIDTSLALFETLKCWTLEIRAYDDANYVVQSVCTQHFAERPCDRTVLIKGTFRKFDCDSRYYGTPVAYNGDLILYDNTFRYPAELVDTGARVSKTVVGSARTFVEHVKLWRLSFRALVPPYVKNTLSKQHLGAARLYIGGHEYTADNFRFQNENDQSRMFYIEVDVEEVCEVSDSC